MDASDINNLRASVLSLGSFSEFRAACQEWIRQGCPAPALGRFLVFTHDHYARLLRLAADQFTALLPRTMADSSEIDEPFHLSVEQEVEHFEAKWPAMITELARATATNGPRLTFRSLELPQVRSWPSGDETIFAGRAGVLRLVIQHQRATIDETGREVPERTVARFDVAGRAFHA